MIMESEFLRGARIVVIGAGAVGAVTAYRLAQAGAAVTVVERRYPGSGTTRNSFAWTNSFGKTPRHYHRLNARSIRDHEDLARELDGDWYHLDGGLQWTHASDEDQGQRLKQTVSRLRSWGYRVETLSPERVMREMEPDLFIDPDRVEEVFYTPHEGWVNGIGLAHGAIRAALRRYSARLVNDVVVGLDGPQGAVDSVKLAGGETLPADVVINAAGPDAARIAAMAAIDLPIRRQPGFLIVTEPAPIMLKAIVHSPETNAHADGGSRLLLHRDDYDERAESEEPVNVSDPLCQLAVDNASAILPGLRGIRAEGTRLGVRPMPKDGHPIVGFEPEVTGLYELVMHSGITLSAVMGLLVTEDLIGTEPPELAPYRPERFTTGKPLAVSATDE